MLSINLTPNVEVPQQKIEYSEFIAELEASGIDTTTIHYDRGEADFSVYGAALSPELQVQLVEYNNDHEGDDELQQQVAGIFQNDNAYDNGDFAKACREMGFQVEYSTVKTTMIPDNKGSSGINRNVEQHHLAVYTITDPKTGASIMVVDSNGNGAIEVEEVFMDKILSNVSANIDTSNFNYSAGITVGGASASDDIFKTEWDKQQEELINGKKPVSYSYYNMMLNRKIDEILPQLLKDIGVEDTEENREEYKGKAEQRARSQLDLEYIVQ